MTDLQRILRAERALTLASVPTGFAPLLLADLARGAKGLTLYIAPDEAAMRSLADTIPFFAPELEILQFPAWDCLPYDRASPSTVITSQRMAALAALQQPGKSKRILLTTIGALIQRVITPFRVRQTGAILASGVSISRERLASLLQANGYFRVDTVAEPGEFALRGSLVDLIPAGSEDGLRLDFFGDEIETIRAFSPQDQRSTGTVARFELLPAVETLMDEDAVRRFRTQYRDLFGATATGDPLYQAVSEGRRLAGMDHWLPLFEERLVTLLDHLGKDILVLRDQASLAAGEARFEAIADYHANREKAQSASPGSYRPLSPEKLYLGASELQALIDGQQCHLITPFAAPDSDGTIDFGVSAGRDFAPERARKDNVYDAVSAYLKECLRAGQKPIIASYSIGARERLKGLLSDHGAPRLAEADSWQAALGMAAGKSAAMVVLPIDHGFASPEVALLSEQDILGDRLVRRRKNRKSADAFLAEMAALSPGDLIVHVEHGIGRYEGLASIPVGQSPHDCVALVYAGGDRLYVPVENIDVLTRYGNSDGSVALDKLGGEAWQRRKAKLRERITAIAHELIRTAAERALRPGAAMEVEDAGYAAFVDRFPYAETDDQERVIAEVLEDLASGRPMDRLVCGDVGFGKTEVAMRAAFAAAMAGYQVAVIAPTTLLARQHYTNFVERFADTPLKIDRLSRLVPTAEATKTREGLTDGSVDIVIGTHAVLAKTVKFRKLGLVIVDEEQRFGVNHKEQLKALKSDVHMLTLTATPIPRTLQMAMSGLRELSVIQTPPVDRLAVRTYVMPWDEVVMREALLREHYRGGQSFFVVPRISDLAEIEEYLRDHVPEVKFVTAHGQMAAGEIEERMTAFYDKRYDVLLSTTIIESGLDIPSANTLIVHRADRFGLAQLYQLRGRVGRSKLRAYAYLTQPADRILSETAEKRLKVLSDLDSLGAGFQLASHDLDIRGAGNLVGDEQSGHIKEVGFELYQSMLEDAIVAVRAEAQGLAKPRDSFSPQITIDAPILIPDDYVPDLSVRMALYRRLNDLDGALEIEGLAAEIADRFGPIPEPTQNLLRLIEIKQNALVAQVAKIEVGARGALVSFHEDRPPNIPGLLAYVERLGVSAKLRPDSKLVITRNWPDPASKLYGCLQLSKGLAGLARKAA
ncbi:MAG: transcription-repair coupling factor [Sphingomonadales bacterium]|jgi:transcription-repair coupling factor (superfamily II helicase)|nr:transcription-repair coupling factor [Sphingomonadales bacterium]MBK9003712.1 transcription-repair coupling factor [Sphingomonadales bacterium]MBK9268886.1 transcription-repair coupling factor [Sphingomonadales bacterium]